jgi:hypothetical protein
MPNNRQIVVLFWLAVLAVWAITRPDVRSGIRQLLIVAAKPKVVFMLICFSAWMGAAVWVALQVGLWEASLATDTVFWVVGSGLVLFGAFPNVSKRRGLLRETALGLLSLTVVIEGLVDALVFPLPVEFVVQPIFAFLTGMLVVARRDERYRLVTNLLNGLTFVFGIAVLAHIVWTLTARWDELEHRNLVLQLLIPFWATIWMLPLVYVFALIGEYELAFLRLDWNSNSPMRHRLRAKLVLLTSFHRNVHEVASFAGRWPQDLVSARSFREGRQVIQNFRAAQKERAQEEAEQARKEAEAQERLVRFAGVDGVGDDGRRLDKREFKETRDALRWLAGCMMGWYRHDNRYVPDLVERFGDDFSSNGLPKPSGISLRVAADGQAWYAWRRTVTGWFFAIGAAGAPPDQWEYDGPQPPAGFPREDLSWGTQPYPSTVNLNWSDD